MTEQTSQSPQKVDGLFARLARAKPTKPGEIYGVPGQGNTLWLSACSIALFFLSRCGTADDGVLVSTLYGLSSV